MEQNNYRWLSSTRDSTENRRLLIPTFHGRIRLYYLHFRMSGACGMSNFEEGGRKHEGLDWVDRMDWV